MNAMFASRIFFGHFMYCAYPSRGVFMMSINFIFGLLSIGDLEFIAVTGMSEQAPSLRHRYRFFSVPLELKLPTRPALRRALQPPFPPPIILVRLSPFWA